LNVVVAINAHPKMGVLLNAANRRAQQLGTGWQAVFVETPEYHLRSQAHQQKILSFMTRAEEMGAQVRRVEAPTVERGLIEYLQPYDEAELFVGRHRHANTITRIHKPIYHQLEQALKSRVTVHPVNLTGPIQNESKLDVFRMRRLRISHVIWSLFSVFLAYLLTELIRSFMSVGEFNAASYNAGAVFMLPPMIMALRYGLIPGLIAALGGFLTLNYFYIYPIYEIELSATHDMVNGALFFGVALVMAFYGSYNFAYAESIRQRERQIQALLSISEVVAQSNSRSEALEKIHHAISDLLEMDVAILLPQTLNPQKLDIAYAETEDPFSDRDHEAIEYCWNYLRTSGCATPRYSNLNWRFEPMITGQDRLGILAIHIPPRCNIDVSFGQFVAALADQAGNILERLELSKEIESKRISEEREKLRSMLLSSVSHDLKTPLASIIGSLSVYHGMYDALPDAQKRELTETALDEAQRLDSFITNILDMTRIESGHVQFKSEWVNPTHIVHRVVKRLSQRLRHHTVVTTPNLEVEIMTDPIMLEQVIQNLIDNAAKYCPAGCTIRVEGEKGKDFYRLYVRDDGPGIPEEKFDSIFDKYARLRQQDTKVAGTGLGLSIVKAVMEEQGGVVSVRNQPSGGAEFALHFPDYRMDQAA